MIQDCVVDAQTAREVLAGTVRRYATGKAWTVSQVMDYLVNTAIPTDSQLGEAATALTAAHLNRQLLAIVRKEVKEVDALRKQGRSQP